MGITVEEPILQQLVPVHATERRHDARGVEVEHRFRVLRASSQVYAYIDKSALHAVGVAVRLDDERGRPTVPVWKSTS